MIIVGAPGFEPGVTCTQNRYVSRYTTLRLFAHPITKRYL